MLKELSELIGVSGGEGDVRAYIKTQIRKHVGKMIEDPYGNLIVKKGKDNTPRIMLAAHMDEVGVMITGIEKEGLLRFKTIGISSQVLIAKRVVIGEERVCGIIGHKPIHQTKKNQK